MKFLPLACACIPSLTILAAPAHMPTHKNFYIEGDLLYMRRTEGHTQSIVKREKCTLSGCEETSQMTAGGLIDNFNFECGWRLGAYLRTAKTRWLEATYMHIDPWAATKEAHGDQDLLFPFATKHLVPGFSFADRALSHEVSHLEGGELNYWIFMTPSRANYFSFSWLAGLRYLRLDESFSVSFLEGLGDGRYETSTQNHLYGAQLGADLQMNPLRFLSLDLSAKIAGYWNFAEQHTYVGDLNKTLILRHTDAHNDNAALGLDIAAFFSLYISRYARIKIGYEMLYLTRLALAPEQVRKDILGSDGKHINTNGEALIHGGFAGLSIGF